MAFTTSGYQTNFKNKELSRNKNLNPNIGLRTVEVLTITGKEYHVYLYIQALIQKFIEYSVLFLYTGHDIYLYFKPSDDIINSILDKKNIRSLNTEEIHSGYLETHSTFIIYPVKKTVLVLERDADCQKLFESLEKVRKTKKIVSNVDIDNLLPESPRITEQCSDVNVSLKLRYKKTIRHKRNEEMNNPLPKPPSLKDIESDQLAYPCTESHDFDKLPTQVSEEQRDETKTERVFSNTGSPLWVYPDSSAARFYLERKQTIGTHRKPARYPEYSDYVDRLRTFQTWTAALPTPHRMSQAGFFFTNQCDLIRCFHCGIGLKDFSVGDDPLVEHVRYSGQCPFLPELLGDQQLQKMKEQLHGAEPGYNYEAQHAERKNTDHNIRHQDFKRPEARLATYSNWPPTSAQRPRQLTEAGLFYTGIEDCVTCFYCGGSLRSWEPNDDPWIEHCRWFPSCGYVRQKKGDEFIARARSSSDRPNEVQNTAEETKPTSSMQQQDFVASKKYKLHEQNKADCLKMGYTLEDYADALEDLRNRDIKEADLSLIIDAIEGLREKQGHSQQKGISDELDENRRLKKLVYCITCKDEEANVLFLPCTLHSYCVSCSESLTYCPLCKKNIIEKIRTYMS